MHRALLRAFVILAAISCSFSTMAQPNEPSPFMDPAEIRETYRSAVVNIAVSYKLNGLPTCEVGSGFLISNSGFVITSKHLLVGPKNQKPDAAPFIVGVVGENFFSSPSASEEECLYAGDIRPLEVIADLPTQDAILLKFNSARTYDYVVACRETMVKEEDAILAMGFPMGQGLSVVPGKLHSFDGPAGMWQTDLLLNFGNSGGPVFNGSGRLIGLVAGDTIGAVGLSWIVPLPFFQSFFGMAQAPLLDCTTADGRVSADSRCEPVTKSYEVDWVNDDHSKLSSTPKAFEQSFSAETGLAITEFNWVAKSVNNAQGPNITVTPDKSALTVSTVLTSGPMFDRWRGWMSGLVMTKQVPTECVAAPR